MDIDKPIINSATTPPAARTFYFRVTLIICLVLIVTLLALGIPMIVTGSGKVDELQRLLLRSMSGEGGLGRMQVAHIHEAKLRAGKQVATYGIVQGAVLLGVAFAILLYLCVLFIRRNPALLQMNRENAPPAPESPDRAREV